MGVARAVKPGTSIEHQVAMLRSRGMSIPDDLGRQWLSVVSYYRLSGYWFPCRAISAGDGSRSDMFVEGTDFSDVIALYEADRKLRTLIHDGMERIEVAFRAQLISAIALPSAMAYRNSSSYRSSFDLNEWLRTADRRVARSRRRNEAIKHYDERYGGQYPFWVLSEVLDFSDISKLFDGLPFAQQRSIAESLGIVLDLAVLSSNQRRKVHRRHPMAAWLEQLTVLRNACAHHSRVWNKSYVPAPTSALQTVDGLETLPPGQSERVFGSLLLMTKLLHVISPGSSWSARMSTLLLEQFLPNPLVAPESMGLPPGWRAALAGDVESQVTQHGTLLGG